MTKSTTEKQGQALRRKGKGRLLRRLEGDYAFSADEPIAWTEELFSMMNEPVQEMP